MSALVSIIMPSYNTAPYIAESINSVVAQTYADWELIIVDDASSDNTDEVVAPLCHPRELNCHPREGGDLSSKIHYLKNDRNRGAAYSRNRALREAKGRWIAFLDSDDIWTPDKLEKQIAFMDKNGYAFSYTRYEEMGEDGKPTGTVVGGPNRITKTGMYNYCWPGCLTVMYDREVVGDIQIAEIQKNNDYAMWLKICRKADCYLLDENLARYRKRGGSISNHSYTSLIKWHYKLYREAEGMNPVASLFNTGRNLFFGVWKKVKYVGMF
ncbi:glycosyltransferase family 2 protein [Fibrobacter sp. UBA3629]|uniref:glycosyltransferase family 2 protein n=1 Tax=Fibrobacter sp. UBA3629 TaxID=1946530 RepID=UPI0025BEFB1F|nr:glycosyltransferase family 2 protein [Fibrobacter sp. UBA3629]